MRVLCLVVLFACSKESPKPPATERAADPVVATPAGPGQLDCPALKRVMAVGEADRTFASLRGRKLSEGVYAATLQAVMGRDATITEDDEDGVDHTTVVLREPGEPTSDASIVIMAAEQKLEAELARCLPDWEAQVKRTQEDYGVRLSRESSSMTINAWIATSDDEHAHEVTLMVWMP